MCYISAKSCCSHDMLHVKTKYCNTQAIAYTSMAGRDNGKTLNYKVL